MIEFEAETTGWLDHRLAGRDEIELELGTLIAAASGWTEDETELDDFVTSLVESGRIQLAIG